MQAQIARLVEHRWIVLGILAAITALAGFHASRVGFDSSIEIWFLEDDANLVAYHEFLDRFESEETVVIGIFSSEVFSPSTLASVSRITEGAKHAPFAAHVRSLTTARIARDVDGGLEIDQLIGSLPTTSSAADLIRRETAAIPLLKGFVSDDEKATAVLVELAREGSDFEGKVKLVTALKEIVAAEQVENPRLEIRLGGSPPFDDAFYRYSVRDFLVFGPVTFLLAIFCIYFVFRRFSAALIPLSVVGIAELWTFGLMGFLGIKVTLLTSALGGLVVAVGVADSVHVLSEYYQQLSAGRPAPEAVIVSVDRLLVPCLFTSLTTAAGMLSLLVSHLAPIREFGWLSAVAVAFAFLLSITFIPAVLGVARPPDPEFLARQQRGPISKSLVWLGKLPDRRNRTIAVVFVGTLVASLFFIGRLSVGANAINYLKKDDPVRVDMEVLDATLGGSGSFELLVRAKDEGLKDPIRLGRMKSFQQWLHRESSSIGQTLSVVDSLEELMRVMSPELTTSSTTSLLPTSRAMSAQLYLLLESEDDFPLFVQDEYSIGRISARVMLSDTEELTRSMPELERKIAEEINSDDFSIEVTGFLKLMADMEVYLLESQIRSMSVAFLVITLMMIGLLRSIRLGLFSMIPNLAPILVGLGVMGLVDIPLDPGTVMIGSIALGLVVDDTVHFLVRLRRALDAGEDMASAIRSTLHHSGRPIIVTSVVLAAGFSVLALGSFNPNVYFGVITAMVIVLALAADLLVLPAMLMLFGRVAWRQP